MKIETLKELRQSKGLAQRQVAAAIGISERVYAYIENGRNPKNDVLIKLDEFYGVSTDYLLEKSELITESKINFEKDEGLICVDSQILKDFVSFVHCACQDCENDCEDGINPKCRLSVCEKYL